MFDAQLTLPGPNPGDEQIDVFSTEGPTREYLQRKVGLTRFPWEDRSWNGVTVLHMPITQEVIAPWDTAQPAR